MKKVLITTSTLPRWEKDTEPRFVLDFAKALSKKYEVTILTPWAPGAKKKEILEGISVIRFHYFPIHKCETLCSPGSIMGRIKQKKSRLMLVPFFFAALWIQLLKNVKKYDLVVAHWLIPQGIVQSFFKKPYICVCHGSDVKALNKGIIKKLKKRALDRAAEVTVVSNELKRQIVELYGKSNTLIAPMGIDIEQFEQSSVKKDTVKSQHEILFVGRLDKIKGVTYLIQAMEKIDAKLVIVGDGVLRSELEEQAKTFGDKVHFMGAVEHSELAEIYSEADVFVAPSITMENGATEGFGLVFIEAMAAGIPVIGTKTGGIKDIIIDGETGYFVKEKDSDAIAERVNFLLENPGESMRIVENAKKEVRRYSWENVGENYINIIEKSI